MKKVIFISFFLLICRISSAEVFSTKSYVVEIENSCDEGNVSCDKIDIIFLKKATEQKQVLKGSTLNRKNTHDFYGYTFKKDDCMFYIYKTESTLYMVCNEKVTSSEKGEWLDK